MVKSFGINDQAKSELLVSFAIIIKKGKPVIIVRKIRKFDAIRLGKNLEQYDNIHINTVIKYKGFLGKSIDLILFITTSLS